MVKLTTTQYQLRKSAKIEGDIFFDSIAEYEVWKIFKGWEDTGSIMDLVRQPRYELIEAFPAYGVKYHKTEYVGDFEYKVQIEDGQFITVTTDVKGYPTPEAKLKAKMFRYFYRGTHRLDWVKYTKSRGIEAMEYGAKKVKKAKKK